MSQGINDITSCCPLTVFCDWIWCCWFRGSVKWMSRLWGNNRFVLRHSGYLISTECLIREVWTCHGRSQCHHFRKAAFLLLLLMSLLICLFSSSQLNENFKKLGTLVPQNRTCLNKYLLAYCYYRWRHVSIKTKVGVACLGMQDKEKVNSRTILSCFLSVLKVLVNHEGIFTKVCRWDSLSGNTFEICKFRERVWEHQFGRKCLLSWIQMGMKGRV